MGSLNFFTPRLVERQKSQRRVGLLVISLLLALGVVGSIAGYGLHTRSKLEADINAMVDLLNAPGMPERQAEMQVIRNKLTLYSRYLQELNKLERAIEDSKVVTIEFIDQLLTLVPPEVSLDSFSLSTSSVSFSATAPTLKSVADLNYSLRQSGLFTKVHLGDPGGTRGNYSINFTGTFR